MSPEERNESMWMIGIGLFVVFCIAAWIVLISHFAPKVNKPETETLAPRFGAPVATLQRSILPETTGVYDLGTSSRRWAQIQTNAFTIASSTTGCVQAGTNGQLIFTGTNCGTGAGSSAGDPFTHPSANVSATTSGLIIAASSTISSGLFSMTGGASTTAFTNSGTSWLNGAITQLDSSKFNQIYSTTEFGNTLFGATGTVSYSTSVGTIFSVSPYAFCNLTTDIFPSSNTTTVQLIFPDNPSTSAQCGNLAVGEWGWAQFENESDYPVTLSTTTNSNISFRQGGNGPYASQVYPVQLPPRSSTFGIPIQTSLTTTVFQLFTTQNFGTAGASTTQLSASGLSWFTGLATFGAASTTDITASKSIHASYLTANRLLMTDLNDKFVSTASSTLYGTGTAGQVLAWANGVPTWQSTSTCAQITGSSALCDGDDATGAGGGSWPFTPDSYNGAAAQSTTTALWLKNTMVIASTTYFTAASSTLFTHAGATWFTGLTGPAPLAITSTGLLYAAASTTAGTGLAYLAGAFNCNTASGTVFGCLTTNDWTNFNNKLGTSTLLTIGQIVYVGANNGLTSVATGTISASLPISVTAGRSCIGGACAFSIADAVADGSTKGASTYTASDFDAASGVISIDRAIAPTMTGAWAFNNAASTTFANGLYAKVIAAQYFVATSTSATSTFAGALYVGTTTSGAGPNIPFVSIDTGSRTSEEAFMVAGNVNDFFENNIKNGSSGAAAQGCWTATNNGGSLTTGFLAMCANSTGFWTPAAYNVGGANDTSIMSLTTGDFFLSQATAGKAIRFTVGGNSTTTLSGNETFNFGGSTSTTYRDFRISTTSLTAFNITDRYNTTILNLSTASTTSGYDLLELWSATSTGPLFGVDQYGHVFASSTTPTLSSCGTGPTLSSDSNDWYGTITVGSVAATGCTLKYGTNKVYSGHCTFTNRSMSITNALTDTQDTAGFVLSQTALTSAIVDYNCPGK